jgi:hypothetical protein
MQARETEERDVEEFTGACMNDTFSITGTAQVEEALGNGVRVIVPVVVRVEIGEVTSQKFPP